MVRNPVALLLLLAACGASDGGHTAAPDDLRLSIVRGRQQTGQVTSAGGATLLRAAVPVFQGSPPADVLPQPVVVKVSVVGSASVVVGTTGPSLTSVPVGTIVNWRVIGEGCGSPYAAVTALAGSDSAVNYWRRGTRAGTECKMVAEGIVGSEPFGSDTARAEFEAGPASPTFWFNNPIGFTSPHTLPAGAVVDTHGNPVPFRVVGDDVVVAASVTPGVTGRTVSWSASNVDDRVLELRGDNDTLVGRLRYRIGSGGEFISVTAGTSRVP